MGAGKLSAGAAELRCCGNRARLHFGKLLLVGFKFSRYRLRLLHKLPNFRLNLGVCAARIDGLQRSDPRLQRSDLAGFPGNCQR